MAGLVSSFKKFAFALSLLVLLAVATVYLFDLYLAAPLSAVSFSREAFRVLIIVGFWVAIVFVIQRTKPLMTSRLGAQATTILQLFLGAAAVLIMGLGVLHTLGVSPESLLTGAGIASLTIGIIISTFVGGILSGALVFTTHGFRVGDDVLINNIPGRIVDITALVTKIRTDVGQISVPNSAIASGSVILTAIHKHEIKSFNRLPYEAGDRVITTYINEEGIVKELTPFHTVIKLDSGREVTFLNNSVLTGMIAVAKITQTKNATTQTKEKTEAGKSK